MTESEIVPRLRAQYGVPGPARWIVALYVDESGAVGGYRAGMAILDGPVSYFAADGKALGTFHIFGDPDENASAQAALARLLERYPIERPLAL